MSIFNLFGTSTISQTHLRDYVSIKLSKKKVGALVVHIGLPKCGSTYLQSFLYQNRARIARYGVLYPLTFLSLKNGHGQLAHSLLEEPCNQLDARIRVGRDRLSLLSKEIHLKNAATTLLSSEVLSMSWVPSSGGAGVYAIDANASVRRIKILKEMLGYRDIKVVLYLRNPVEWIESMYRQQVKFPGSSYSGKIQDFLKTQEPFSFLDLYKAHANTFGRENCYVVSLEDMNDREDVARVLVDILGLKWDGRFVFDDVIANEKTPSAALEVLRCFNADGPLLSYSFVEFVLLRARELGATEDWDFVEQELYENLNERFAQDCEGLRELAGICITSSPKERRSKRRITSVDRDLLVEQISREWAAN